MKVYELFTELSSENRLGIFMDTHSGAWRVKIGGGHEYKGTL
ncbi:hypothetical protein ANME2D_03199 [Candidatus Methanoperedens nitroreducens]|uniref:Uncharacterized protein n=1 Tax=Candidatus Methanoperedens nitratireducens TaxID=1392998 RepID=A0A062V1A6_9EURY|nr:hypothetical protein ANME2D_03199 [Candidatus Methanoperedens nitroreducens]MDJ1421455.1 hypothetical protein [Candidatus Methanoperedens sp.]